MSALINNPASERALAAREIKENTKPASEGREKISMMVIAMAAGRVSGRRKRNCLWRRYGANCVCVSRINALGRVTNDTDGGHGGAQINDLLRL